LRGEEQQLKLSDFKGVFEVDDEKSDVLKAAGEPAEKIGAEEEEKEDLCDDTEHLSEDEEEDSDNKEDSSKLETT
jgi:hypothetical protein